MPTEKLNGKNVHFLISYTVSDKAWAEWIGSKLEQSGYQTILRDWDIRPGQNAVIEMDDAIKRSERTLLVLTPAYLNSDAFVEWAASFRNDPHGRQGRVLPVRVALCNPEGFLGALEPVDLVGWAEQDATKRLLDGILQTRAKNDNAAFPGPNASHIKIPDKHFLPQIQNLENLMRLTDYDTAFVTIDRLLRNLYNDYLPRQRAWLLYLQGLVYLKGKRPRYLTHGVIGSTSKLLVQAGHEHPSLRVYAATLAAIEIDYADSGLRRSGVDLQALLDRTRRLHASEEDKPAINILSSVQPELYQAFRHLF